MRASSNSLDELQSMQNTAPFVTCTCCAYDCVNIRSVFVSAGMMVPSCPLRLAGFFEDVGVAAYGHDGLEAVQSGRILQYDIGILQRFTTHWRASASNATPARPLTTVVQ